MSAFPDDLVLDAKPIAHLPLIRGVIDRLRIQEVIDDLLPPDPRSKVSDGECVKVMLLNILQGRVALYDMERWLSHTDVELLLGEGVPAGAFNDARLASCLDHIAETGTEEVLSAVVKAYLADADAPSTYTVHQDTTSISLHGAYENEGYFAVPARGYSKDHRPDLKQLVFGLSLHGSAGIPLVSTVLSGNAPDSFANRLHLDTLADLLPEEDEVTLVADCKLVDGQTLGQLDLQCFHFISLLPKTYALRSQLVDEVRAAGEILPELARTPGASRSDPERIYRGRSFERPFPIGFLEHGPTDSNVKRYKNLRLLVVESTALDEQEEESLQRRLSKERATYEAGIKAANKRSYACETDARQALDKVTKKLEFHRALAEVGEVTVPAKRARRGRPRADEAPPTATSYHIVETAPLEPLAEAIEALRFHSRHFVLLTDHLDREKWPDERILAEYRQQHLIEGTTGFRWLKNIATVAPVFLHTPHRIAALGVVLMLALMVRNYIQFELRRRLVEEGETVPDRLQKPTQRPTTETALLAFAALTVVHVTLAGQPRGRNLPPLPKAAKTVLRMLRLPESLFTTPPARKIPHAAQETSEM
jgi:transposase